MTAKKSKTVKISKRVHEILELTKGNEIWKPAAVRIHELINNTWKADVDIRGNAGAGFYLWSPNNMKEMPIITGAPKTIRISLEDYEALSHRRAHPDESLNTTIYRTLVCENQLKPVFRIFSGEGCGNCRSLEYAIEKLSQDPEFEETFHYQILRAEEHDAFIQDHEKTSSIMLPFIILYDGTFEEVWSSTGLQEMDKVTDILRKYCRCN